ncbi:LysE family translocator [Pseudodesulfovibrio cashew]|uniref:LysE family translocator n=1 Tax=Pseudodesulfovibrio cashew TaxID=2678688 RepID=A0A6I6JEY6_9BACT|nr:LysE family translocator [Pseudodesulfovibrio cashew]QGY39578.1 LysE family translocator [Pseudodesulfovibrio cashew]
METYAAFVLFVIVMTGTPGMGNLSMMAIGQTTGFRSSLSFLAGTTAGAVLLNTMVALGLGGLFTANPQAAWFMKIGGMAYILYLGWKIIRMQLAAPGMEKPLSFRDGLFLHPTNPKSWTMAVVGFSQFANPEAPLPPQVVVFVLTFMFFQVSFHSLWGLMGMGIMQLLRSRSVRMGFNIVLVTVMVGATAYAMLI